MECVGEAREEEKRDEIGEGESDEIGARDYVRAGEEPDGGNEAY